MLATAQGVVSRADVVTTGSVRHRASIISGEDYERVIC